MYIDGDLFKAQVTFDLVEKTTEKTVEDAEIIEETDASEAAEKPKKDDELKKQIYRKKLLFKRGKRRIFRKCYQ